MKLSAYEDDIMLFVSNPNTAIPNIIDTIRDFGAISDFRVNLDKSELLWLGAPPPTIIQNKQLICSNRPPLFKISGSKNTSRYNAAI